MPVAASRSAQVLCWLLTMVVGGAEGVVPGAIQDVFRVDELLLASETRAHIFLCGQCVPFVLTKARAPIPLQ